MVPPGASDMNTKPVRLTKFQCNELYYLLKDIMSEGFDEETGETLEGYMADFYQWANQDEFDIFVAKLGKNINAPSRIIEMTEREAVCAYGEFDNRWDIDSHNVEEPGDEYDRAAKKMVDAMRRVQQAFPEVQFSSAQY